MGTDAQAVFAKLLLVYGKRFSDSLGGVDPATARAHWAHELRGYRSESIAHGLANLPQSFPPTVLEFAAICRQWQPPAMQSLPSPKANAAVVARERKTLENLTARLTRNGTDPKVWAMRLQGRHALGENLTRFQIDAYRRVLERTERNANAGAVDAQTGAV